MKVQTNPSYKSRRAVYTQSTLSRSSGVRVHPRSMGTLGTDLLTIAAIVAVVLVALGLVLFAAYVYLSLTGGAN